MEINFLKEEKNDVEFELDNFTLVEILRVYLNKDSSVEFAAWKRVHPTESPIMAVRTSGKTAKKAINEAVSAITKDLDKVEKDFDKAIK